MKRVVPLALGRPSPAGRPLALLHARALVTTSTSSSSLSSSSCCSKKSSSPTSPNPPPPAAPAPGPTSLAFWQSPPHWRRAGVNTLRCLVGCSLGDLSTLFALTAAFPALPVHVTMPAAMVAGITTSVSLETLLLKRSESALLRGISWREAFKMATKMSMVSMLAMEATENVVDLYLTGGVMDFSSPLFWASMGVSMAAGFVVPLPYNYFMLRRFGKSCH